MPELKSENEYGLTDGQPLHWDLTFSATIPTAASLPSIDLTTPATSFPGASNGPASVPVNTRVCLGEKKKHLKSAIVKHKVSYVEYNFMYWHKVQNICPNII